MDNEKMNVDMIMQELEKLPHETLVYKTIKGKKQPYLQWSEGGKTRSRYVKISEREKVFRDFQRKEELKQQLSLSLERSIPSGMDYYYVSDVEMGYQAGKHFTNDQLISIKDQTNIYSVERDYINSKAFHDKFSKLPLSHNVQEQLYREVGRLLDFVDGLNEERMTAISARTGAHIVDNFPRSGWLDHTGFCEMEYKKIQLSTDSVILIHNHSSNSRPSAKDIVTYSSSDKVKISVIACHDGTLYVIWSAKKSVKDVYEFFLNEEKKRFNDSELIKRYATNDLYYLNDKLGKKQKLFELWRL